MWNKEFAGPFNQSSVGQVDNNMKGLYFIHTPGFETMYIGKSDSCVKTRLQAHLRSSSNKNLRSVVNSGADLLFMCWDSPNPKYEEALEIKRLKSAGLLHQRSEKKPLIEYLD
ncbi:hypothetical protein VB712_19190 [Spirulina sp. CCNP1310]|uniref:hypothetical protein n=1 Tax=Spirulina sp. CCNP1310 TaxID=3110249 RepID=UPI002B20BAF2|nr:hypothetical protein [Spirulina sp. CCNP1310]MEA5421355.1 hypothetical protein [Spirulina sp. CCNP1310]